MGSSRLTPRQGTWARSGDLSTLADTTVVLLIAVFAIVNVAVLVLRRERVEHEHFHAPSMFPVLGALVSVARLVDTALDDPSVFLRAAILLAVGAALWLVNRLASRSAPPPGRAAMPESARR